MRRYLANRAGVGGVVLGAVALHVAGCTFVVGEPWGALSVSATAAFAPPAARLTESGQVKTARDYGLSLDEVTAEFAAVRLRLSTGEATLSFDPRDPPAGYSLCHGGHCHASDGRLVDYAEIEAELSGGVTRPELTVPVVPEGLLLTSTPSPLTLSACTDGCLLERGTIDEVSLELTSLRLRGRAFDLRPNEDARLPTEGLPFVLHLDVPVAPSALAEISLDGSEPSEIGLEVAYALPAELFDEVLFEELPLDEEGVASLDDRGSEALVERISESSLEVTVRRRPGARDVELY